MFECIDNEWLEKEMTEAKIDMPLEEVYRHIKESYLHHKFERNAVFLPKAELMALMCIQKVIAENDKESVDRYVKKSVVLQMLHEAYADGVISAKDGCRALYKRLDDIP